MEFYFRISNLNKKNNKSNKKFVKNLMKIFKK